MTKEEQPNSFTRIEQCFLFLGQFSPKAMKWSRARYMWGRSERQGPQEGAGAQELRGGCMPRERQLLWDVSSAQGSRRHPPYGKG